MKKKIVDRIGILTIVLAIVFSISLNLFETDVQASLILKCPDANGNACHQEWCPKTLQYAGCTTSGNGLACSSYKSCK